MIFVSCVPSNVSSGYLRMVILLLGVVVSWFYNGVVSFTFYRWVVKIDRKDLIYSQVVLWGFIIIIIRNPFRI